MQCVSFKIWTVEMNWGQVKKVLIPSPLARKTNDGNRPMAKHMSHLLLTLPKIIYFLEEKSFTSMKFHYIHKCGFLLSSNKEIESISHKKSMVLKTNAIAQWQCNPDSFKSL